MPRVRRIGPAHRSGPSLADLATFTDDELVQLTVDAPGATTVGWPAEWRASPAYGVEAERILRERGVWG